MLLLKEKLTLTSSFGQAAKNLYLTAFPENERLPWCIYFCQVSGKVFVFTQSIVKVNFAEYFILFRGTRLC